MDKEYKVEFSVFRDRDHLKGDSNLDNLVTIVHAFNPIQAQAMVEAQYNGFAKVWSVFPK